MWARHNEQRRGTLAATVAELASPRRRIIGRDNIVTCRRGYTSGLNLIGFCVNGIAAHIYGVYSI